MPTAMLAVILVMSGFNSVALIIVADPGSQPEDITVTVDLAELLTELQPVYMDEDSTEITEIPEEVQPVPLDVYQPQKGEYGLSPLFNKNAYFVVGEKAFCTDVLGAGKISYALAFGGAAENPEGRTDQILTDTERKSGNLIIVGGPAVNPVATQFGRIFRITYEWNPDEYYQINAECKSIYLDLRNYPQEDICLVYVREYRGRNILMVWGYGWQGTYAGSVFAADPDTWEMYPDVRMIFLRWKDVNNDGLVQQEEITVETSV
jgi:hypothetical protein